MTGISALRSRGPFTVFVPTTNAFKNSEVCLFSYVPYDPAICLLTNADDTEDQCFFTTDESRVSLGKTFQEKCRQLRRHHEVPHSALPQPLTGGPYATSQPHDAYG